MKLELAVYGTICEPKLFAINGIKATYKDFGEKYDQSPERNRPNCCGNMVFEPRRPTRLVLEKYGIDVNEYDHVCSQLARGVSFGTCRLCS